MMPHLADECWKVLGGEGMIAMAAWPAFDAGLTADNEITLPVQVNGKLRAKIRIPADADRQQMQDLAAADETIAGQLEGKNVVKTIVTAQAGSKTIRSGLKAKILRR